MSISKSTTPPLKRPKPLTKEEFDRCVVKIGHPEMEVRRWIGQPSVPKRQQKRPENFSLMEARAVRMLAVYPKILSRFLEVRRHFPQATILAIRPFNSPDRKVT